MSTYREPGVYLKVIGNPVGASTGVEMLPCIIGPGAKHLPAEVTMTRSESPNGDALPYKKVTKVKKIAAYEGGPAAYVAGEDFNLSIDDQTGEHLIQWASGVGPSVDDAYFVSLVYEVEDDIYELQEIYSRELLIQQYGDDIAEEDATEDDPIPKNLLVLAGKLLFENGADTIWVRQVKTATGEMTKSEYEAALDDLREKEAIWRVIPTQVPQDSIVSSTMSHVAFCSSYEERKERTALLSVPYTTERPRPSRFSGSGGVYEVIGNYTSNLQNERAIMPYPDQAEIEFSDGQRYITNIQMVLAAFAGAELGQPISQGRTRMEIGGIYAVHGINMTRKEKNLLAAKGVMLLDQESPGLTIRIRHQLTTDMRTTQSREASVIAIKDYLSKALRQTGKDYIGRRNITPELTNLIESSFQNRLAQAVRDDIIISGVVENVYQDEDEPDTVLVQVRAGVPYPCNYIDIIAYAT